MYCKVTFLSELYHMQFCEKQNITFSSWREHWMLVMLPFSFLFSLYWYLPLRTITCMYMSLWEAEFLYLFIVKLSPFLFSSYCYCYLPLRTMILCELEFLHFFIVAFLLFNFHCAVTFISELWFCEKLNITCICFFCEKIHESIQRK